MDYCAKESTLQPAGDIVKEQTIKASIQEAYSILRETNCLLMDLAQVINGDKKEDRVPREATGLWDETRLIVALAYENLQRLAEIKGSII